MAHAIYMDVHIPIAITEGLRRRGIDVLTSQEDGTNRVDDATLLDRATELGRLLFSEDTDLLAIAQKWQSSGHPFAGLLFAHQEGPSIGRLTEDIELVAECLPSDELANRVIYLPLN